MASLPQSLAEASLPSWVCLGNTGQTPDHPDPPPPHAKTLVTLILRHEKPPLSGLPGRGGGDRCGFLWGGGGLGYINPGGWARPPRRAQVHDCHQDKSNIIKFQSAE